MALGKRRLKALAEKRSRKIAAMKHASGMSKYGRKHTYCERNGVFGFQVPDPKPWVAA